MPNSKLTVSVQEILDIRNQEGRPINAWFTMECEEQQFEIGISDSPDLFRVGKEYEFEIQTGDDPLRVLMTGVDGQLTQEDPGWIELPLYNIND